MNTRRALRAVMALVAAGLLLGLACPPRVVGGKRGCVRQGDCEGGEICDTELQACVGASDSDAGICVNTFPGCADDTLNNRHPSCPYVLSAVSQFNNDVVLCPQTNDYFGMVLGGGDTVQVLAWSPTSVDIRMVLGPAAGAGTVINEAVQGGQFAYLAGFNMPQAPYLLEVGADTNATYDLFVVRGPPCSSDATCGNGRCEQVFPDPRLTTPPAVADMDRGGVCIPDITSACDAPAGESNRRSAATTLVVDGTALTHRLCALDVDWFLFSFPAAGADTTLTLTCSAAPGFVPVMFMVNGLGQLEWAGANVNFQSGTPWQTQLRALEGTAADADRGTHLLGVRSVAGADVANCSVSAAVSPVACTTDSECSANAENARFLRTRCSGGACVRP